VPINDLMEDAADGRDLPRTGVAVAYATARVSKMAGW